ncbi:MAG TPA: VWA domain-containing protein [Caulobacteraceae bacterium]|jgi:Ca-activated chloride channel family protein|nr:VWA domain-containing protein [Caulobacteraceae bacterium]
MTFIWMEMLWLLLLVPVLVAAYLFLLRRKKAMAVRYANLAMVKQAMGPGSFRRHIPPLLFLASITLMLLATARPAAVITLASQRAMVLLTMDLSGSMRAADVDPSRIVAAQKAAKEFIKGQPRDVRIGIVGFAGSALLVQAPTTNKDDLDAAIDRFELQRGTAMGSGILVSLQTIFPQETFELPGFGGQGFGGGGGFGGDPYPGAAPLGDATPKPAKKPPPAPVPPGSYPSALIIVMTDGQTTTGPDPVEAARMAANHGVRVFTVGFGSTDGEVVGFGGRYMRAQLDEEGLKQVADMTKGQYFRATTAAELKKIYEGLNTKLIKERKETEITALFAAVAASLAILAAGLSMLWFNRIL